AARGPSCRNYYNHKDVDRCGTRYSETVEQTNNYEEVNVSADDSDIPPDGKTKVHVRVTCDGTPVEGANVEIKVEPVDSSGGHIHVNDRPKGRLNGTDLTKATPSITLPT